MSTIGERVVELHRALNQAGLPHAFGGALALAWCTADPRGTGDIDLNVFVPPSAADQVLAALPREVRRRSRDLAVLARDGQGRLWWGDVPVDLFLSTTPFHDAAATRARVEPFLGATIPFLACEDVAVFKAFFNRTRDWADLEDMAAAGTIDRQRLDAALAELLGAHDPRLEKLARLPWKR